jgi:hypothetical protein
MSRSTYALLFCTLLVASAGAVNCSSDDGCGTGPVFEGTAGSDAGHGHGGSGGSAGGHPGGGGAAGLKMDAAPAIDGGTDAATDAGPTKEAGQSDEPSDQTEDAAAEGAVASAG